MHRTGTAPAGHGHWGGTRDWKSSSLSQKHNQTRNSHNSPLCDQKVMREDSSGCCLAPENMIPHPPCQP